MFRLDRWHHRHTVLLLCGIAYFSVRFIELAFSVVTADIKATLNVSTFVIGLAVAASTLTYAAIQLPSGALGDRFGERAVILVSVGFTGLASVVLAASPSGVFIILGMALVGVVSGAYYSPATALLTDLFDETGRAIGSHRLGAQLVGVTGPLVGLIGAIYGWRIALLLGAAIAFPVLVGFYLVVKPRSPVQPERSLREQITVERTRELLSRPSIAFTTAIAASAQFVDTATFSFLPLLLREYHGLSIEFTGVLFTVYFAALTVGQPIAGWLSDRIGRDIVTAGALLVGAMGYVLLAAQRAVGLVIVAIVLIGLGMGWGPPVQSRAMDHLDTTEQGVGFGLVRSVYIGFAALNGIVIGGIVPLYGWTAGISVLTVSLVAPAIAIGLNHGIGWNL